MAQQEVEMTLADVQEEFFERGWTDGLPIVPPTPDLVAAMLAAATMEADDVVGTLSARNMVVTAEQVAINAVMAGCKPEYFPIVVTAAGAVLDPAFNAHSAMCSTGGAAVCIIVSGPLGAEVGMNARHNALGSGNRANATIGRAIRLMGMNVLGARKGKYDASSIGTPAKYSLCFLEDVPPEPWVGLNVRQGYEAWDTTVTVLPTEGPRQIGQMLNEDATDMARTYAAAVKNPTSFIAGKGGQVVLVVGPEHGLALRDGGWSQRQLQEFVAENTRISEAELNAGGILVERGAQHDMTAGADGKMATIASADDVFVVTAGGEGAGWSAFIPTFAPTQHFHAVTRRVRIPGEAMPDCGPDACEVDLSALQGTLNAHADS